MNSVRLYYIKHQGEHDLAQIDANRLGQWVQAISAQKRAAVQRLLHERDRRTSLIGLRLLDLCAQDEGIADFKLSELEYPQQGKPFWKNDNGIYDFNISHSGDMILVAASDSLQIGADAEAIKPLKRLNFKMVLSAEELTDIEQSPALFFELWSKKEAVVKAADTTGIARMRDVSLQQDKALLDEKTWHLKTVALDDGYAVNLASSAAIDELIIKQISLIQLR